MIKICTDIVFGYCNYDIKASVDDILQKLTFVCIKSLLKKAALTSKEHENSVKVRKNKMNSVNIKLVLMDKPENNPF